ncbi:methyltransferase [archaeon]|nr:methyltransferase [archaeon]
MQTAPSFSTKRSLGIALSKLKGFEKQDIKLEQYQTDSEIAADSLWLISQMIGLKGKVIADFGCGNGLFGIGALLLGAKKAYFIDIDQKAVNVAKENLKVLGLTGQSELLNMNILDFERGKRKIDIVIQNPPFGVQRSHNDKMFLLKAFESAELIFSFHKINTAGFIEAFAQDSGFNAQLLKKYNFSLKKIFWFHTKQVSFVDVGLWMFRKGSRLKLI